MFQHFISLGFFCGIAASLSRYGLRSFSSPFDWCFSDFYGVIHFIENDFSDFLNIDNLEIVEEKSNEFKDIKYGLHFNHDVKSSFKTEYAAIRQKYLRRIEIFLKASSEGVCFVRAVQDEEELSYISNNVAYINEVIKKHNKNNSIIYLIPEYMNIPAHFNEEYFILKIEKYVGTNYDVLRELFETSPEFISYCIQNFDSSQRNTNLLFDLKKEHSRLTTQVQQLKKDIEYQKTKTTSLKEGRDYWKEQSVKLESSRDHWKEQSAKLESGRDYWKEQSAKLESGRDFWKEKSTRQEKELEFLKTKVIGLEEGRDFWKETCIKWETKSNLIESELQSYQNKFLVRIAYKIHSFFEKHS